MISSLRRTARAAALAAACCGGWLALSASPAAADPPSWVFAPGTYSHDPYTGARVAQYYRTPPVEPLPDTRMVTSRYRRTRTNLRGTNGSVDTEYQVRAWANGRGGLDAEWERFHDAWQESIYQGSYFNSSSGYGFSGPGFGGRHRGFGGPGYWGGQFPGPGYGPGPGGPGGGFAPGGPGAPGGPPFGPGGPGGPGGLGGFGP